MSEHFSGHELESGLLQRLRSWRDVLPVLSMLDALRVSGSPIYVGLWLCVSIALSMLFFDTSIRPNVDMPKIDVPRVIPFPMHDISSIGCWAASLILITFPAALTIRAGALYAAGRDGESIRDSANRLRQRAGQLLLVVMLPIGCVLGLGTPIVALALIDRIPSIGDMASELFALFSVPVAILLGLIGAGSAIAIPIGLASIAIEKRSDPFDALSRGYEYLYRRPVQTLLYVSLSFALSCFLRYLAGWIAYVAMMIYGIFYSLGSGNEPSPFVIRLLLHATPNAVFFSTMFATWGAVYLLLRKDANQQEIEDIAVSPVDLQSTDLPSLRPKA